MSRARHKGKAGGGPIYSTAGSRTVKEAEMKAGVPEARAERMKVGGKVPKKRMDKRARGGRIGSDKSPMAPGSASRPYSSACKG